VKSSAQRQDIWPGSLTRLAAKLTRRPVTCPPSLSTRPGCGAFDSAKYAPIIRGISGCVKTLGRRVSVWNQALGPPKRRISGLTFTHRLVAESWAPGKTEVHTPQEQVRSPCPVRLPSMQASYPLVSLVGGQQGPAIISWHMLIRLNPEPPPAPPSVPGRQDEWVTISFREHSPEYNPARRARRPQGIVSAARPGGTLLVLQVPADWLSASRCARRVSCERFWYAPESAG